MKIGMEFEACLSKLILLKPLKLEAIVCCVCLIDCKSDLALGVLFECDIKKGVLDIFDGINLLGARGCALEGGRAACNINGVVRYFEDSSYVVF